MASFPTSTATKPSGIIDGATIFAIHVAPLWDEVIVLENILRGVSNQSIGSLSLQGAVGQVSNLFSVGTSASATDRMFLNAAGRLSLPVQGSGGGVLIGGDAAIYRGTGGVLESAQQFSFTTKGTGGGIKIGGDVNLYRPSSEASLETNFPVSFKTLPLGTATDIAFQSRVDGDSVSRLSVQADGKMSWGPGTGAADTTLTRSGANALAIGASVSVTGAVAVTGSITSNSLAVVTTNDSRLTDSRTPTGSAGGDLTGTYPNPTLVTTTFGNTPGVYRSVTVNAKGLVTAGTNPTTLAGYGITDAQPLDSTGIIASIPSLSGNGIIVKTGTGTTTTTSIATASTSRITVSNASGVSGSPTIDLASNVIASPGTFNSVTVDTYGRVTAGTNQTYVSGVTGPTGRIVVSTAVTGPTGAGAVSIDLPTGVATPGTYNTVTIDTYGRTTAGSTAQTVSSVTGPSRLVFSVTGPTGANAVTVDLGTVGTAGTYNTVTTDSYGRVSAGSTVQSVSTVTGPSGQLTFSASGPTGTNTVTVGLATAGTVGTYNTVTTDSYGRVTSGSTAQTVTSVTGPSRLVFTVTGPTGANAVNIDLGTVGTAGTNYTAITTDAYGRVTSGSNPTVVGYVTGPAGRITFSSAASVTGPTGTTAITLDLATTGNAGTYNTVTTDAYGRVTAGSTAQTVTSVTGPSTRIVASASGPTGANSISLDLATAFTGPTGTAYKSINVDQYGRVISATNPTTLSGYGITDAVSTTTNQNANTVWAGPSSGAATGPTFRSLVIADLPNAGVAGTASSTQVVRGDDDRLTDVPPHPFMLMGA